jgi:flagellar hook protein FlgE
MLRSMFSGISGLRAHQQMMDVTGNNIANVNTTGFKSSTVTFQDTLSQMVRAAGSPQGEVGGTNPAQIGLGVRLGSVGTNFGQGAAQNTGKSTDLLIQGDGFFMVRSGGEQLFTRSGAFDWDNNGNLVNANGNMVQGWLADNDGNLNTAAVPGKITLPLGQTIAPQVTTNMKMIGNLQVDAPTGTVKEVQTTAFDATGRENPVTLTFTKQADGSWNVGDGTNTGNLAFGADGRPTAGTLTLGGVTVDVAAMTHYSGVSAPSVNTRDGSAAGTLNAYSFTETGEIVGVFSNGLTQVMGQVAMANFNNVSGLEKVGNSMYRMTVNSGLPQVGPAGTNGLGYMSGGQLEMSNVDLAQEFTNLVIAQRGFQANSRVITSSDEILQDLVNIKR